MTGSDQRVNLTTWSLASSHGQNSTSTTMTDYQCCIVNIPHAGNSHFTALGPHTSQCDSTGTSHVTALGPHTSQPWNLTQRCTLMVHSSTISGISLRHLFVTIFNVGHHCNEVLSCRCCPHTTNSINALQPHSQHITAKNLYRRTFPISKFWRISM